MSREVPADFVTNDEEREYLHVRVRTEGKSGRGRRWREEPSDDDEVLTKYRIAADDDAYRQPNAGRRIR